MAVFFIHHCWAVHIWCLTHDLIGKAEAHHGILNSVLLPVLVVRLVREAFDLYQIVKPVAQVVLVICGVISDTLRSRSRALALAELAFRGFRFFLELIWLLFVVLNLDVLYEYLIPLGILCGDVGLG